jgi:outer membrane protein TolC
MALQRNTDVVNAEADILQGRSALYSAYADVLPSVSATYARSVFQTEERRGIDQSRGVATLPVDKQRFEGTTPSLGATWNILDLSAWSSVRSAGASMKGTGHRRQATRNEVILATRRQFYEVVRAIKLAEVTASSVKLAQDEERRVRALFEVGSVSKSDLLTAQVRTAQSEVDLLRSRQTVTNQRVTLANLVGQEEAALGEVDTVLTFTPRSYDEAQLLEEARRQRPDLMAAEAELAAARSQVTASRLAWLPAVVGQGSVDLDKDSETSNRFPGNDTTYVTTSETHRDWSGSIALQWRYGASTHAGMQGAQARLVRADEGLVALQRNLAGEVRQAIQLYEVAVEGEGVARRALESALENLKLNQEKYNVGSATILELINAQVQLQRTQSDLVSALAGIRAAEAEIERVRGAAGDIGSEGKEGSP